LIELITQNEDVLYLPNLVDELTVDRDMSGSPSTLSFKITKDDVVNIQEGNPVRVKVDGEKFFYGFVFNKKRSKDGIIEITAYDQLRYLKNKDTITYTNKRADEVITLIADKFNLKVGELENTKYLIVSRVEDNKTLMDMIDNALDLTLTNTKELYILYDDFGEIMLKNINQMQVDELIDSESGENFSYTTSIDNSYNQIKLIYEDSESGKSEVYITKDSDNINNWGVLQYFEKIEEQTNGKLKADSLLSLYNAKTRDLSLTNVKGILSVRGGSFIAIQLNLGDIILNEYMLVEKCKHKFKNNEHFMDLTLKGW